MSTPGYAKVVEQVMTAVRARIGEGQVADYIPDLGHVDPKQFGLAVATVDGEVHQAGEADTPFAMESISKLFSLALVLGADDETIWKRVGREPSGEPFNSLLHLDHGIPRNPFINPGAIVVVDELLTRTGNAYEAVRGLLRAETGDAALDLDGVTENSEARTGDRNRSLAYLISSYGNLHNPVPDTLRHYFDQCSIMITCVGLAKAGLLVARRGLRADGSRLLTDVDARRVAALMLTCGTYDEAGDFAFRVGLPCKSGVGGGILAIVPGRCSVAVWGPGLDEQGNSVTGRAALEAFVAATGWSIF